MSRPGLSGLDVSAYINTIADAMLKVMPARAERLLLPLRLPANEPMAAPLRAITQKPQNKAHQIGGSRYFIHTS